MSPNAQQVAAAATRGKHFTLYVHIGPNPWKVLTVMYELGFRAPNDINLIYVNSTTGEHKKAPYTDLNPNGRMPALVDHENNDYVIWESGAIILYLIEKYDTEYKISFENFEERLQAVQWLMFQMSGQGPYWGQATWFSRYHPEKVPSAITRYTNEIHRTIKVLDGYLSDKEYLVQNKPSYADISFVAWFDSLDRVGLELEGISEWRSTYASVARWHKSLKNRKASKEVAEKKAETVKPYLEAIAKAQAEAEKQKGTK